MDSRKSFQASVILIAAVITVGTAGYFLLEGWDILDSLYTDSDNHNHHWLQGSA